MHDVESLCHWHNKCRSKDLVRRVMHYITTSLLCNADAKWRGHHCRLVADMADDVRHVCTCANQELSLPLKTDHFNKACSTFVLQADNLGCSPKSFIASPTSTHDCGYGQPRRLRSSLIVPPTRLTTVGDRAFPVVAARVWNGLSPDVTSAPSLPSFKRRLKTELFAWSYPDSSGRV